MSTLHILDCQQGSQEWFDARIGVLTASRIGDAVRKAKRESTGELQGRRDLKIELAVERITRKPAENFVSMWMTRGTELEPLARAAYELRKDTEVRQVGFVLHPTIKFAGCSPDGLCGADGMVELKVPKSSTHAEYLLAECVPEIYIPQILWQMACCPDRKWSDFVSYCPDFPEPLDVFICRIERDDKRIAEMEAEARKFLDEVALVETQLKHGLEGVLRESLVPRAVIPTLSEELSR